jgi:Flp pilus assembly protein TadG
MRRQILALIQRFHSDERGAFLVIFGVMAIVLVAMAGAVVDYVSIEQARTRAQVALDSAALALHERIYDDTPEEIRAAAEGLVQERVGDFVLDVVVEQALIDTTLGSLTLDAQFNISTMFVSLVGIPSIEANVVSEVTRGSLNIEVALALDVTGSMSGQKIIDLRNATADLIDLVVQDVQTPTYSKLALVPYSSGVNMAGYAAAARGPITAPTAITGASWSSSTAKASRARPGPTPWSLPPMRTASSTATGSISKASAA